MLRHDPSAYYARAASNYDLATELVGYDSQRLFFLVRGQKEIPKTKRKLLELLAIF